MATNTFKIDGKTGAVSAVSNVRATRVVVCECGTSLTLTVDWPENLIRQGEITIGDSPCPVCSRTVVLPTGKHWVENFQLMWEPLPQANP